ncbi:MAG: carboxypeptidase regulatory-like domain-containing protein [Saprospiraceae bacterium]|nr:carboxypeptidase regulatory-like domain-containing protein [Saprospiraceae bacterium]
MKKQLKFTIEGTAFDEYTGLPISDVKIMFKDKCANTEESYYTNAFGRYTFNLSENCCYELIMTHPSYSNSVVADYCTKGLLESKVFLGNAYFQIKEK